MNPSLIAERLTDVRWGLPVQLLGHRVWPEPDLGLPPKIGGLTESCADVHEAGLFVVQGDVAEGETERLVTDLFGDRCELRVERAEVPVDVICGWRLIRVSITCRSSVSVWLAIAVGVEIYLGDKNGWSPEHVAAW